MEAIKIMLVDDHRIFLEGLRELIDQQSGMEVVSTAVNGEDLLIKMRSYHVDVVIMDIQMTQMNGIEAALELRKRYPEVRILFLSMHGDKSFVQRAFDIGADGYLIKHSEKNELIEAIETVYQRKKYFRTDAAMSFLKKNRRATRAGSGHPVLSKREIEILILIAKEFSNPDIANLLHLSVETVNTHRKKLLQKLGVKNTAGLVKYAIYNKLLQE